MLDVIKNYHRVLTDRILLKIMFVSNSFVPKMKIASIDSNIIFTAIDLDHAFLKWDMPGHFREHL